MAITPYHSTGTTQWNSRISDRAPSGTLIRRCLMLWTAVYQKIRMVTTHASEHHRQIAWML